MEHKSGVYDEPLKKLHREGMILRAASSAIKVYRAEGLRNSAIV